MGSGQFERKLCAERKTCHSDVRAGRELPEVGGELGDNRRARREGHVVAVAVTGKIRHKNAIARSKVVDLRIPHPAGDAAAVDQQQDRTSGITGFSHV